MENEKEIWPKDSPPTDPAKLLQFSEKLAAGVNAESKATAESVKRLEDVAAGKAATPVKVDETVKRVEVTPMADVQEREQFWLWPNFIPWSAITIFSGNPDTGKSTVLADVVARFTRGDDWPNKAEAQMRGHVLMLVAEDDLASTVKPRLMAAGADLSRIGILKSVIDPKEKTKAGRMFAFDRDRDALEFELDRNPSISLVVVDPITSYLGKAGLNKEQELREILSPLRTMCETRGLTIVAIAHFNKNQDVQAIHRVGGAVALSGLPRAVFMFARSPEDEDVLEMHRVKGNLGKRVKGLTYRIAEKKITERITASFIEWTGEAEGTADDLIQRAKGKNEESRAARAKAWLAKFLTKPTRSRDVEEAGREHGLSRSALWEAKDLLGIRASKHGSEWLWYPADYDAAPVIKPNAKAKAKVPDTLY